VAVHICMFNCICICNCAFAYALYVHICILSIQCIVECMEATHCKISTRCTKKNPKPLVISFSHVAALGWPVPTFCQSTKMEMQFKIRLHGDVQISHMFICIYVCHICMPFAYAGIFLCVCICIYMCMCYAYMHICGCICNAIL